MECVHFPDDPNAVCTICKPKPVVDAWDAVPCEAKYYGLCVVCEQTVYPGDVIISNTAGWAHEDCRASG